MQYSVTKHEIGSDDEPAMFFTNGQHYLTVQSPLPISESTIAAFIADDLGHDVQHVVKSEHDFYSDPVFERVTGIWIDTQNETVYLIMGAFA